MAEGLDFGVIEFKVVGCIICTIHAGRTLLNSIVEFIIEVS